jgi:hypothetical protein
VVVDKHLQLMKGYHPLANPLAEQKSIRGSISDIVDEKNQKTWNLLPEKTGRFSRKAHTGKVAIGMRLVHLFHDPTPLCLRGCEGCDPTLTLGSPFFQPLLP